MANWKTWLKGVIDGRPAGQAILVTGSARMETFRQGGESLAGRYVAFRLHPISVREWCEQVGGSPGDALERLMERGGFPEPCLADDPVQADRWRRQYFMDLVREDVVEFSRIHEINAMRLFAEMLRDRVGSPLPLASIARDLAVSPVTPARYLDILQALYIVFTVHPWHRNIGRAILKAPKVYFFDTGLVRGDDGVRFENTVAAMLLKHVHHRQDAFGEPAGLHYIEGTSLHPVRNPQSPNLVEMGDVVADQNRADASRVGGDHHVHGADRRPFLFKHCTDFAVMIRRVFVPGNNRDPRGEIVDLASYGIALGVPGRAEIKFGQDDRGNSQISRTGFLESLPD
ncbi:MAG: hypothetical protein HW377_1972 [Actinobacteria bacterium]|nr:hypothetical protein [Actinomycetota bacterium]